MQHSSPLPDVPTPPPPVLDLARRVGVTENSLSHVSLTQVGTLRGGPDDDFRRFRATQIINLHCAEFEWRASTGPLGLVKVTDALTQGQGDLRVRVLGLFSIAQIQGGGQIAKAEVMRYLAELPWAPDALVANRMLAWNVIDNGTWAVGVERGGASGEVKLMLGVDGLIASVSALRPRVEGGDKIVERPWHGRFSDYRWHRGRMIPFHGEVGWTVGEREFVAWRGELRSWRMQ